MCRQPIICIGKKKVAKNSEKSAEKFAILNKCSIFATR